MIASTAIRAAIVFRRLGLTARESRLLALHHATRGMPREKRAAIASLLLRSAA